ncbi:MAG: hypothetical protein LBP81_03100 [Treponema sp.]|nr:hypothetical protein [Treponema sp.]
MIRRILLFFAFLVSFAPAKAQEEDPPETPEHATFPVSLLLETAETAGGAEPLWRPDWPMELPPDLFRGRGGGSPFLSVEAAILPAGSEAQRVYRFARDREGRVREFPFLLGRVFFQAEFSYNDESLAAAIVLKGPGEADLLDLEVLEWEDSRPSLIRVLQGESYAFVFIQRKAGGILEAWYDTEGRLLEAYDFTLAPQAGGDRIVSCRLRGNGGEERYDYDGRGFVTGISGSPGDFSVLYYLEDLPRYREYRPAASGEEDPGAPAPGVYSLRWDEKAFLLSLSGIASGKDADPVDCRYEYTLDEGGNWIERREIRMIRGLGLLIPSPGVTIRRILEYEETE